MQKEQSIKLRNAGRILGEKIIPTGKKDQLDYVAKQLGFWDNKRNAIVMDAESDMDVFAEYLIYQPTKKGAIVLDDFYESDIELSDLEEDFLEAMVNSYASLFTIQKVDPDSSTLVLKDELDKDNKEYTMMDINLSQTAKVETMMYTRLLPVEDVFISSGLTFAYYSKYLNNMINHVSSVRFRKRRKLTEADLIILCHKKYNEYGIEMKTTASYE